MFQQHGTRCRMWVPPEVKDSVLLHAPTRKSVACFGSVSLSTGRFVLPLVRQVRRAHVRSFPEEVAAALFAGQAHGDRAGQREIPPCRVAGAFATAIPQSSEFAVPAAIQSATGPDRAGLEAGTALGDAQPLLRNPG